MDEKALLLRIAELEKQLIEKDKLLKKQEIKHKKEVDNLLLILKENNENFDKTLEKLETALLRLKSNDYKQFKSKVETTKKLVPDTEGTIDEVDGIIETEEKEKKKPGRKAGGKNFSEVDLEELSKVNETIYIRPDELICPKDGEKLVKINDHITYKIVYEKHVAKVIKIVTETYKCPKCNKENHTVYSKLSDDVFSGGILTPSFAAHIMQMKYDLGVPLHHLEQFISNDINFPISKQFLAHSLKRCADLLLPIYQEMKADLLKNEVKIIHSDETTLTLAKPNLTDEDKRKKFYVYVYASSFYDPNQCRIYSFNGSRSIEQTQKWLEHYDGYICCDSYSGYNKLSKMNPNIKLQKCLVHCRRKFTDILEGLPENERKGTQSYKIIQIIDKVFENERSYRKKKYSIEQIEKFRKIQMEPIKDQLYECFFETKYKPGSAIDKAVDYCKKSWNDLWRFIDYPYLEPSNNLAERAVEPFVLQRKQFTTCCSENGAENTAILFSIMQSAKTNGLDVFDYLSYVFKNLNKVDVKELLPYSKSITKKFLHPAIKKDMA